MIVVVVVSYPPTQPRPPRRWTFNFPLVLATLIGLVQFAGFVLYWTAWITLRVALWLAAVALVLVLLVAPLIFLASPDLGLGLAGGGGGGLAALKVVSALLDADPS